jgi:hypothetical protein
MEQRLPEEKLQLTMASQQLHHQLNSGQINHPFKIKS